MMTLRILLVDDHDDGRDVLARLLRREGHDVTTAIDFYTAVAAARQHRFDLLIADMGLPDRDGMELMSELSTLYPLRGIAVTAFGEDRYCRGWREAGFFRHLKKPFDYQAVLDAISDVACPAANPTTGMSSVPRDE